MKKILLNNYRNFVLALEIFMAVLLLLIIYNYVPINHGTKTFYMPSSDLDEVVQTLRSNGYEVTAIDKMMLKVRKLPDEGWYHVEPHKQGRYLFFQHLYKQKTDEVMDIIVYAGETKEELTSRLANDMKLDQEKLLVFYKQFAQFKEADILAQRYTIARKADEETTMKYIFMDSRRKLHRFIDEYFNTKPEPAELKVVHVIASIIQKESNSPDEMPLISSVIYNRLERDMKLQMDGTLNYGPFTRTIVTPERIRNDTSEYNTYKHKGLPPHPLSTVTLNALEAAMKPSPSDYLFFMLKPDGSHSFSATYDEHLENIRRFREYQKKKEEEENATTSQIPLKSKV